MESKSYSGSADKATDEGEVEGRLIGWKASRGRRKMLEKKRQKKRDEKRSWKISEGCGFGEDKERSKYTKLRHTRGESNGRNEKKRTFVLCFVADNDLGMMKA